MVVNFVLNQVQVFILQNVKQFLLRRYYITEDNNQNCFKNNTRYDNYYFNSHNNKFEKCNIACLQYNELGDTQNIKCIKCKESDNYYPKEDNFSMCLKHDESSLPEKYYYDSNTKKFKKCQK